jgi:hypothetical protein
MHSFQLSKWYADCTSENGNAAIVYHADLRWRAVTLHYQSLLTKKADCPAQAVYSLRNRPAPCLDGDTIGWQAPHWQASGTWQSLAGSLCHVLYESGGGSLRWNCLAPRAAASVEVGPDFKVEGWGYVEHLVLTIAPWMLPIQRLCWGRFINATDTLVWIDWVGAHTMRALYLNGSLVLAREVTQHAIELEDGGMLTLNPGAVLREGMLGATALKVIPNLQQIFPNSILGVKESKWLSPAILRRPGRPDSTGMAIHEVVEWP